ncbi:hypothetical protein [Nocardia sp. NPDC057668]|uniref:hypothetical protein n=1 Tax=Nocardia sp. NPDC057668 TaxID=3346202 RepID=UPI00366D28CF
MELGKDPRDGEHTNAGATAEPGAGVRSPYGTAELPAVWGQPDPASAAGAPPEPAPEVPNYPPTTPFPAMHAAPAPGSPYAATAVPPGGAQAPGGYEPMPPFPTGGNQGYGYPPNPHGYNPYGPYAPQPATMPASVKAARVVSFLFGGLGLVIVVAVSALGDAYAAGVAVGGFAVPILLAGFAFGFGSGGNGIRVTAIVLAVITMLMGLGGAASQSPPGPLGLIVGLAVLILLCQSSASAWFKRPRDAEPVG